jgi:hypothetical protein
MLRVRNAHAAQKVGGPLVISRVISIPGTNQTKVIYKNGAIYQGQWKNDKREGIGSYTENGVEYYGTWVNDKKTVVISNKDIIRLQKTLSKAEYTFNRYNLCIFINGQIYQDYGKMLGDVRRQISNLALNPETASIRMNNIEEYLNCITK